MTALASCSLLTRVQCEFGQPAAPGLTKLIHAYDVHACGGPGRLIVGGVPDEPGVTMCETMCHLRDHMDWVQLRKPRGYPAANRSGYGVALGPLAIDRSGDAREGQRDCRDRAFT